LLQEITDVMAHLYPCLENLVHGVQNVGHPCLTWCKC